MPSVKKQLIVVSLPGKNMFSVRGAASPTPCYNYYNTHTQIMNNEHHKYGSAALDDLCECVGANCIEGSKQRGEQ